MHASDLPSICVPLVGLIFPAIVMASSFIFIENSSIN
uniref:Photosystem I reaction center subunit VIII n=1 Tax=Codium arabicum TaxID=221038 RepID=A0A386B0N7_CODAR|nr:photosystem I reaction center subunit VIII [Codium arabicum]AYC65262.1 photosystem I reaction center subunit VIII [Codium arabicum]